MLKITQITFEKLTIEQFSCHCLHSFNTLDHLNTSLIILLTRPLARRPAHQPDCTHVPPKYIKFVFCYSNWNASYYYYFSINSDVQSSKLGKSRTTSEAKNSDVHHRRFCIIDLSIKCVTCWDGIIRAGGALSSPDENYACIILPLWSAAKHHRSVWQGYLESCCGSYVIASAVDDSEPSGVLTPYKYRLSIYLCNNGLRLN